MEKQQAKKEREDFIISLIKLQPSMPVMFIDKVNDIKWPTLKRIDGLTPKERKEFNLRRQLSNELILDIEDRLLFPMIKQKLEEYKWAYTKYDTGSRGYHISICFSNMSELSQEMREYVRKYYIAVFDTDKHLVKESQWLAMEYSPHFKTNKLKIKEDGVKSDTPNTIPNDVIEYCEDRIKDQEKRIVENKEVIKDFHKTDPYLKYVLENQITNGDRNMVLFKNLAIGLSQSGISREEIEDYATRIVIQCPGKTVGEFMGWVDKAINEGLEYNKSELKQWSVQYDHPRLYKFESDEEPIDFMSIKMLWDELWKQQIVCQDIWRDLCFYNLLGTILDEKDDDLRAHVIFSSYSSTGKDEGINIVERILESLQYKTSKPADITDKTLVGSVNEKKIEQNVKYGLSLDVLEKGSKQFQDPIEKGLLADHHWMAFGEAETVFKPGPHNRKVQVLLRQAMDKSRRIEKGVGGYKIPIVTNTSFILTTYKQDSTLHALLHNGLFQRALFFNKNVTQAEHEMIRTHINDAGFKLGEEHYTTRKIEQKLIGKLKIMKKWYLENRKEITPQKDMNILVNNMWANYEKNYAEFVDDDKEILNSLVRRSAVHLKKLTTLNAVWNMTKVVTKENIETCFKLVLTCVGSIQEMVIKQDSSTKRKFGMLKIIEKGSISKGALSTRLKEKFGMKSTVTQTKAIKQVIDTGFVTSYKDGRLQMLTITPKGREYLDM